jgi:hypothetical protein
MNVTSFLPYTQVLPYLFVLLIQQLVQLLFVEVLLRHECDELPSIHTGVTISVRTTDSTTGTTTIC